MVSATTAGRVLHSASWHNVSLSHISSVHILCTGQRFKIKNYSRLYPRGENYSLTALTVPLAGQQAQAEKDLLADPEGSRPTAL